MVDSLCEILASIFGSKLLEYYHNVFLVLVNLYNNADNIIDVLA